MKRFIALQGNLYNMDVIASVTAPRWKTKEYVLRVHFTRDYDIESLELRFESEAAMKEGLIRIEEALNQGE